MMRNHMISGNPQVVVPNQQRVPLIQSQFEPRLLERDLLPSADLIMPNDTRQIHVASQFGHSLPAHTGYGILQTDPMDFVARRQELLQKHNINRIEMEMSTMYPPRDIDKTHRKGFPDLDTQFLIHGMPANPVAVRGRQIIPEGPLASDLLVHRNAFDSLHGAAMLKSTSPYPPMSSFQKERARRPGRRAGTQKLSENNLGAPKIQAEKNHLSPVPADEDKDEKKEEEADTASRCDPVKTDTHSTLNKSPSVLQDPQEKTNHTTPTDITSGRSGMEKGLFDDRFIYQPPVHLSTTPYSFPVAMNSPVLPGSPQSLFLTRDDLPGMEDIRKWTSQDVYNFIVNLPGCSGYAQVFKDHDIDGLTLPLLTEEHLLDTMGLKLGPALRIRSQISSRFSNIVHMPGLQLPGPMTSSAPIPPDHPSESTTPLPCSNNGDVQPSPSPQDQESLKPSEVLESDKETPCDLSITQTDFQLNFLKG
ncbi:hypothetical protein GDO86_010104 [Hymenochirus boettgeri]|uniref:SAM domain-containing protein n=1 Tax=Hymenochirus boettgeri TaxID=247094 RepID=A0A8T2JN54_9PIPI|nr:hypothetical protein GDO86_010104 [Hymenochirus boettgeri]